MLVKSHYLISSAGKDISVSVPVSLGGAESHCNHKPYLALPITAAENSCVMGQGPPNYFFKK